MVYAEDSSMSPVEIVDVPEPEQKQFSITFDPPDDSLNEDQRLEADSVLTPLRSIIDLVNVNSTIDEALSCQ